MFCGCVASLHFCHFFIPQCVMWCESFRCSSETSLLSSFFCPMQIRCWGNVEWAHDYDMYELRARTAAGALFVHLTSESSTVKHKLMQDWIRCVQVLVVNNYCWVGLCLQTPLSQCTNKLWCSIFVLLRSNHSSDFFLSCVFFENSSFLTCLVIHSFMDPAILQKKNGN